MKKGKGRMAPDKEEMEILTMIGGTLILLQSAERTISRCMLFVFQKGEGLTLEDLEKEEKQARKKTLGQFIFELRKRVELEPDFDEMLERFVEDRNQFVHRIETVPGWDLESSEGRQAAHMFISRVFNFSTKMLFLFSGFL